MKKCLEIQIEVKQQKIVYRLYIDYIYNLHNVRMYANAFDLVLCSQPFRVCLHHPRPELFVHVSVVFVFLFCLMQMYNNQRLVVGRKSKHDRHNNQNQSFYFYQKREKLLIANAVNTNSEWIILTIFRIIDDF